MLHPAGRRAARRPTINVAGTGDPKAQSFDDRIDAARRHVDRDHAQGGDRSAGCSRRASRSMPTPQGDGNEPSGGHAGPRSSQPRRHQNSSRRRHSRRPRTSSTGRGETVQRVAGPPYDTSTIACGGDLELTRSSGIAAATPRNAPRNRQRQGQRHKRPCATASPGNEDGLRVADAQPRRDVNRICPPSDTTPEGRASTPSRRCRATCCRKARTQIPARSS